MHGGSDPDSLQGFAQARGRDKSIPVHRSLSTPREKHHEKHPDKNDLKQKQLELRRLLKLF